jgi:hypothetical protein
MLLMFGKRIRDGYCCVLYPRYVKADNKYIREYKKEINNYLLNLN